MYVFKDYLPLIRRADLSTLQECLVAEITFGEVKCFLTCLFRSSSHNDDGLEIFCFDLNFLLNNVNKYQPSCLIAIDDFNAKHSKESSADKNNKAGFTLDNITSTSGYNPIHFTSGSSSCIFIIFFKSELFSGSYFELFN